MLLALTRGLFVASLLSSFGAALFIAWVFGRLAARLDGDARELISARLRAIVTASLGLALLAGFAWLTLQTSVIAETESVSETAAQIPAVLAGTRFGQALALQAAAVVAASLLVLLRRDALVAAFTALAVLLEAGHSHASAMAHGLSALLASQALHLLAAGAWLGGLAPLLVVVRRARLDLAQIALKRFSAFAAVAVGVLAGTALLQGVELSGGLKGFIGTQYGAVLLVKAALFAILIALALNNRLRLTPGLNSTEGENRRRVLVRSIVIETAIGFLVVIAAAALSGMEPGMHLTQD
jgi:putative copper export protein